ncbi:MAG: DUF433 domain-containing protein [Chloroflexi bacterium]|nr:DUF433 domain-containing protein [Chloroflexota bacterium]
MALTLAATPAPLEMTSSGSVRVRGSRVTLDTIVAAFERGASAEEIVLQYPTLQLADVYSVIGYYLRHQAAVAVYLREQEARADEARQRVERRSPQAGIRARLLARTGGVADG